MDRLRDMQLFVRVVETGSFSAAARHLGIGQPAISKAMAALEERLGARLLVRSTRRLRPTEAGTAFYERAVRAIAEANEAEAAARGASTGLEGRLRICSPVTFGRLNLIPKLGAFLEAHPKIQLEVVMDDRDKDLVAENIDAAFRCGVLPDSAMVVRKLAQTQVLVVASPAYLARKGVPSTPMDLLKHDGIIFSQTGEDWVFRRGDSETHVRIPRRLTFSAAEGVRAAVIAGLGFTICSRWIFAPELQSGEVVPLLKDWHVPPDKLWVIYPSGRLTSTKARAFVNWFEKIITRDAAEGSGNQLQRAASAQAG